MVVRNSSRLALGFWVTKRLRDRILVIIMEFVVRVEDQIT